MRVTEFAYLQKVDVTWVDTVEDSSWNKLDDIIHKAVVLVETPGRFVTNKNISGKGSMLVLATSLSEDKAGGYAVIPWGCIRKVEAHGGRSKDQGHTRD